ncbi:MAG: F0F1 ATP synthase subunit gamma [Atribacterota bacterium]|nr:F0F1 ATP synthase subunit gamma [Atribacterota bacterium]
MQTLETIRRKIESAKDMHSVVKTMKALAAVNIHTYEKAVDSINFYHQNIEAGLQIVLKENPDILKAPTADGSDLMGIIIFGAERGMAGNFNIPVINKLDSWIKKEGLKKKSSLIACVVGERIAEPLKDIGISANYNLEYPNSRYHLDGTIQDVLLIIEKWRFQKKVSHIYLFFNHPISSSSFKADYFQLYPLNHDWLRELAGKQWPSTSIPLYTIQAGTLFNLIIRQYFYISLYKVFIETMASENASRLLAMRKAEKNIEEQLEELDAQFNKKRQDSITDELLDIVAGFEALTK